MHAARQLKPIMMRPILNDPQEKGPMTEKPKLKKHYDDIGVFRDAGASLMSGPPQRCEVTIWGGNMFGWMATFVCEADTHAPEKCVAIMRSPTTVLASWFGSAAVACTCQGVAPRAAISGRC